MKERQRSLKTYSLNRTHDRSYIGLEEWQRVKYRDMKAKGDESEGDEEMVESSIEEASAALKRKQEEKRRQQKIAALEASQQQSVTSG